jgi:chaperonin GroEL (HSP60 family)
MKQLTLAAVGFELAVNSVRGWLKVVAVKASGFGERRKGMLEYIAILTPGSLIGEEPGIRLENVKLTDFGKAKKVLIEKENTTMDKAPTPSRTSRAGATRSARKSWRACRTTTAGSRRNVWRSWRVA